jgi:hypothetical protein
VEVNGRKLVDHEVELENKKWNIEINGKRLMDHAENENKKEVWTLELENDKIGRGRLKKPLEMEEPERNKRMLRPVDLVPGKALTNYNLRDVSCLLT